MRIIRVIRGFVKRTGLDHLGAYAAQASYFIILSFIPFIMLLMTLVQYTPVSRADVQTAILNVSPEAFHSLIQMILEEIYSKSVAIVSMTAVTAVWSAGRGIMAITNGLNSIYHVEETRNYVWMRLRSAAYTVFFILTIILSLVLLVFGNRIHGILIEYAPILAKVSGFLISIRTVGTLCILTVVFLCLYRFLPNRKTTFKRQLPGAVLTAGAWTIFSFVFSLYIDNFSRISYMYGSLTTLVIVMLWLYSCMYIVLLGAEINAYFEGHFRSAKGLVVEKYQEIKTSKKDPKEL